MTTKEMLKCINYVDDGLIVQAVQQENKIINKKQSFIRRSLLVAVCLAIVVSIGSMVQTQFYKNNEYDNLIPNVCYFFSDGYGYEILHNEQSLVKRGLSIEISENEIGKLIEKDVDVVDGDDEYLGDVYEYNGVVDRSVVILKDPKGNYYYALRGSKHDSTIY